MEVIFHDILSTLQSGYVNIYIKAIVVIQILIAIYMILLFFESMSHYTFIKILYIACAVFLLALGNDFLTTILGYFHNSNFLSFILGVLLTFAMLFASSLRNSTFLSPLLLSLSFIVIAKSLDGTILWSSDSVAIWGTAGKVFGLALFHSLEEKFQT